MGIRILLSNDDGWDSEYSRELYAELVKAGHDVVLSAPLIGKVGRGNRDEEPDPDEGEPTGTEASSGGRIHWVRSHPVTAARYGLDALGPRIWEGEPCDLVLAGPNDNWNTGRDLPASGTAGIAQWAAAERGIPAVAVSLEPFWVDARTMRPFPPCGPSGITTYEAEEGVPLEKDLTDKGRIARLVVHKLVAAIVGAGGAGGRGPPCRLLPEGVWLNVNLPFDGTPGGAADAELRWVLSRIDPASRRVWCDEPRTVDRRVDESLDRCDVENLPTEQQVLTKGLNRVPISINGDGMVSASREDQLRVKEILGGLLACNKRQDETGDGAKISDDAEQHIAGRTNGDALKRASG